MELLRIDFHSHSIFSKDSLTKPQQLVDAARRKRLDRLVVTDHNSIGGALEAKSLDPELVIVGEEIMTIRGEILAAFVTEEIPAGLEPSEVIRRLKEQGAFISVSHPFDIFRSGHWELPDLLEILPHVDAIETFNARAMDPRHNTRAEAFAREHGIPATVGSDAHTAWELGNAILTLQKFTGADELRQVIRSGKAETHLSSPFIHFTSRFAVTMKKLGWIKRP